MNETITLQEIAKNLGVPRARVKTYFERGKYLEYVPRPQNLDVQWVIYRKDYEKAIERKERQLKETTRLWDDFFELDALAKD